MAWQDLDADLADLFGTETADDATLMALSRMLHEIRFSKAEYMRRCRASPAYRRAENARHRLNTAITRTKKSVDSGYIGRWVNLDPGFWARALAIVLERKKSMGQRYICNRTEPAGLPAAKAPVRPGLARRLPGHKRAKPPARISHGRPTAQRA